jgi:hypothetical protein
MPKARMCHICGRQTLLAGYAYHIEGCAKLFLAREEQKPKKERRPLPVNPFDNMAAGGKKSAAEMNELSQQAYNGTLSECAFCGRRFLPEKLLIHNKSCRADKPARGVNDSVNRRQQDPSQAQSLIRTGGSSTAHHHYQQQQQRSPAHSSPSCTQGGAIRPESARRLSADNTAQPACQNSQPLHDNSADLYAASSAMIPAEWSQCQGCGRTFNEIAFAKHTKICDKIFCTKRAAFDSKKHRLNGTDAAQFSGTRGGGGGGVGGRRGAGAGAGGRGGGGGGRGSSAHTSAAVSSGSRGITSRSSESESGGGSQASQKWRAQSSQLRQAMQASRQVTRAQKEAARRGVPLTSVLPPAVRMGGGGGGGGFEDPSFIRCPHCSRTFNEKVGGWVGDVCQFVFAECYSCCCSLPIYFTWNFLCVWCVQCIWCMVLFCCVSGLCLYVSTSLSLYLCLCFISFLPLPCLLLSFLRSLRRRSDTSRSAGTSWLSPPSWRRTVRGAGEQGGAVGGPLEEEVEGAGSS